MRTNSRRWHGVTAWHAWSCSGSAATGEFDPETSDLDFLVEFVDKPPGGMAHAYFGLLDSLSELFDRRVDLVSTRAISNPYFLKSVNESRRPVYVA